MYAAVIDIGSNSIRYMEANVTPQGVFSLHKELCTTRLAAGITDTGCLSSAAMEDSLNAIALFCQKARAASIPVYAYATSAVRDAANSRSFVDSVLQHCNLQIDILSGKQEAHLAFLGATGGHGNLIDIGGGSAQIITPACACSHPVGSVRMKDLFSGLAYPEVQLKIYEHLSQQQWPVPVGSDWTGVGGAITTLAALSKKLTVYEASLVSNTVLTQADIQELLNNLIQMGDVRRRGHPLLKDRHDTIIYGTVTLAYFIDTFHIASLHVSDADGMEGYLLYRCASA